MSVGSISSSINTIQLYRAQQAFKSSKNLPEKENKTMEEQNEKYYAESTPLKESSENVQENRMNDFLQRNSQYIGEIKDFITQNNYENIQNEDLRAAISYGKSILADYTA